MVTGNAATAIPAAAVEAVDTTGAGDAFIGSLAFFLARGDDLLAADCLEERVDRGVYLLLADLAGQV